MNIKQRMTKPYHVYLLYKYLRNVLLTEGLKNFPLVHSQHLWNEKQTWKHKKKHYILHILDLNQGSSPLKKWLSYCIIIIKTTYKNLFTCTRNIRILSHLSLFIILNRVLFEMRLLCSLNAHESWLSFQNYVLSFSF